MSLETRETITYNELTDDEKYIFQHLECFEIHNYFIL